MTMWMHPILTTAGLLLLSLGGFAPAAAPPDTAQADMRAEAESHPFFRTAVYPAWSRMTPQQAMTDLHAAMAQTRTRLENIAALPPEQYNFSNTFLAYTEASENLNQVQLYLEFLTNNAETPELVQLRNVVVREYAEFKHRLEVLSRVWQVLHAAAKSDWAKELPATHRRVIQSVLRDLKHTGVHLTPEQRTRKALIEQELQFLSFQFSHNLNVGTAKRQLLITDPAQLDGMPDTWMKRAAEAARAAGHGTDDSPAWLINLSGAHADAVLYHCTVQKTRRDAWLLIHSAGTAMAYDNEPVIYRIMELRHELAVMLGYKHYADMKTADRMMRSGENALAFVDEMLRLSKPAWDAWVEKKLRRFSAAAGQQLTEIAPWDEKFILSHRREKATPDTAPAFNEAELTPYLEVNNVLSGMLRLWSDLLGVTYTEIPTVCLRPGESCPAGHVETWAPNIRCFEVRDTQSGKHLGSFFLDIFPRPNKRTDLTYCFPLRTADPGEPTIASMVSNFPATAPGKHCLLSFLHLRMLFHEFGHLMHMCLAEPPLRPLAAMNVEIDFVETPSHLQESWIWEPETLSGFARHHLTGDPIPPQLLQQLSSAGAGASVTQHISMLLSAKLDLELHMHFHEKFSGRPLDEATAELLRPWLFPGAENTPSPFRTLTHCIVAGYDAGFYTYKWSEVLAADAFSRFRQEGLLNPATGAAYRRAILTPGATEPAEQLFRNFMGRDPNPAPLLRRYLQDIKAD